MNIKMYVLGLLKFKDGKIVFSEKELDCICSKIGECIENGKTNPDEKMEKKDGWCVYTLNLENLGKEVPEDVKIESARLGYCHHRVIVHFNIDLKGNEKEDKYPQFRKAREILKKEADELINKCVKEKINEIIPTRKDREGGEVKFVYTYPFIIMKRKHKKHKEILYSDEISTLCFELFESYYLLWKRKYIVKITIPSTILYTDKDEDPDESFLRDMINAIYQHCLYEKKARDEKKKLTYWDYEPFENVLDEDILVKLWTHILDTMGGRTADIRIFKIMRATFLVALLAFLITFISLIHRFFG